MSDIAALAEFVAPFHGKLGPDPELHRLVAWCASAAGISAGAPPVAIGPGGYADISPDQSTDNGRVRWQQITADYADWIINTLKRPPDWHSPVRDAFVSSGPNDALSDAPPAPADYSPNPTTINADTNELTTWAAAWCEANPA